MCARLLKVRVWRTRLLEVKEKPVLQLMPCRQVVRLCSEGKTIPTGAPMHLEMTVNSPSPIPTGSNSWTLPVLAGPPAVPV